MAQSEVWRRDDVLWLEEFGLTRFGLARLERPLSIELYDQWLAENCHAEMEYLVRQRDQKADPMVYQPLYRSALVFAIDYITDYVSQKYQPLPSLQIAAYARSQLNGEDYHRSVSKRLQAVVERLTVQFPKAEFKIAVDSSPILERDLAHRAGLGWVGKNTCLIDRNSGSLFFIAEILASLNTAELGALTPDHCGTCTRCLDACPTQAISAPRKLDARRCISYWTIEAKTIAAAELRTQFGDWFFGCDICQTVCPWNRKRWSDSATQPLATRSDLARELRWILSASNSKIEKTFRHTALSRARGRGLKRNALIVTGNRRLHELADAVEPLCRDAYFAELAQWTLDQLAGATGGL